MTSNLSEIGICHGGTAEASPISYFTCLGGGFLVIWIVAVAAFRDQSCPGSSRCGAQKCDALEKISAVNHEPFKVGGSEYP